MQPSLDGGPPRNSQQALIPSAAYTTTQSPGPQENSYGRNLAVVLDVTNAGTGSVTLSIDEFDEASSKWINMLTGLAVVANATTVYRVSPHLAAAANAVAQLPLPKIFRVVVTANNANPVTYSVGYKLSV